MFYSLLNITFAWSKLPWMLYHAFRTRWQFPWGQHVFLGFQDGPGRSDLTGFVMSKSSSFAELESDFFHYMKSEGGLAVKTSHDYISRLRFLAQYYSLDEGINPQIIKGIISEEREKKNGGGEKRKVYASDKALSDFHAGLMKFMQFINSDYRADRRRLVENELSEVSKDSSLSPTVRAAVIQSRIGQGLFRDRLKDYWKGCCVSGCRMFPVLMASHIKPWKDCNNKERLDVYYGLLLLPNFDRLFDKGYISFEDSGGILYSSLLKEEDRAAMQLSSGLGIRKLTSRHQAYLAYHRENIFMG